MTQAGNDPSCEDEPQLERRIAHDYFCRFHMVAILAAVIASGVLASKGLLELGVSLGFRYPIAVFVSYGVFLLLVRVWIWYVSLHNASGSRIGGFNFGGSSGGSGSGGSFSLGSGSGGSGSSGGFSGFGGGDSGGGGASGSWEGNEAAALVSQPSSGSSGSSGGHWWSGSFGSGGGGGDDDGWLVVLLLAALVAAILGGGVYLVVAAPHILPEAAAQVVLAGSMTRISKEHHHNWMSGVIWSTWIPFVIVLFMAGTLGWEAHRYCPTAHRLIDLLNCPGR
jgi:hypothetical protein